MNPPVINGTMAQRLRQISSAVRTKIASSRSLDKGLCSLGMISLNDYRLLGYLTSKYYLPTGQMSVRHQDCKNEMCGCFFFLGTCVSKPDSNSPRMRKVCVPRLCVYSDGVYSYVYTCMCILVWCTTCLVSQMAHNAMLK